MIIFGRLSKVIRLLLLHVRDIPLLLLIFLLSFYFSLDLLVFSPCLVSHDRMWRGWGECCVPYFSPWMNVICVLRWQWDTSATVSKMVVVTERKWVGRIDYFGPTHTLSLSRDFESISIFGIVCRGSLCFFATISCHKSRTDAMLKVGVGRWNRSFFFFFF